MQHVKITPPLPREIPAGAYRGADRFAEFEAGLCLDSGPTDLAGRVIGLKIERQLDNYGDIAAIQITDEDGEVITDLHAYLTTILAPTEAEIDAAWGGQ